MSLISELQEKRAQITEAMMALARPMPGATMEDVKQFVLGYVHLIEQAAQGNTQPREDYLQAVIPSVKATGMPLDYIINCLNMVNMALASQISRENLPWCAEFCWDYTERLLGVWNKA